MLNRSGNTTDNLCFRYRFRDVFSRFRCCVYNGTGPLFELEVFMRDSFLFAERISTTFLSKKPSFKAKQEIAGLCCLSNTRPDANLGSPVLFTRPA